MSTCICNPCGRAFTGLTAFDKHQDVDYSRRPAVRCQDPTAAGLVQQPSGRWGFPIDAASRLTLQNLRAKQGRVSVSVPPGDSEAAESSYGAPASMTIGTA
jgi:hypothetical protein